MMFEIVHVIPSRSAAGTVKRALALLGVREKVVAIGDHLGYGPISGNPAERRAWLEENLSEGHGEEVEFAELSWNEALAPETFPIIWTCRSDAGDHAGFLEFISRIADRPFEVIDATGLMVEGSANHWRIRALGVVSEKQMIAADLPHRRRTLTQEETEEARET